MQQKTEIPFSDLTMEDRSEVSRVLLFWNRPHPAFVNDEVIARLVKQTDGPFQINFVTEPDRAPAIDIVFEGGFAFNFSLYKWDIGIEEATQLFNEFIEQNLDIANDYFLDHPKWLGL